MDESAKLCLKLILCALLVITLTGIGPAAAHTNESFHSCCSRDLEHVPDARQTNLPACNLAHKQIDTGCNALCCIGSALIGDPCPGIIGCPGGDCPLEFDLPASQCADGDGDGLLDTWETVGVDVDGDGSIDIDLPSMGADPMHKDLFLELDYMPDGGWEPGFSQRRPTQATITEWKRALCAAPTNAGGTMNPDGRPGINLWVDTGGLIASFPDGMETPIGPCSCGDGTDNDGDGLTDDSDPKCLVFAPDAGEDGAGAWTCNDGIDNNDSDGADELDPDCMVFDFARTETDIPLGSCLDGIDNDMDGLFDIMDTDCLVGDNFGGGNEVSSSDISGLSSAFYTIKSANFAANRALVFRYALSAGQPGNNVGQSTGSNAGTTLNDSGQSWVADEWAERTVEITGGRGSGQTRTVSTNTATRLSINSGWSTVPDASSEYTISLTGGQGELGGNDFIDFNHTPETLMHELGHTLNLDHGGDEDNNCKPNYVSIMNYDHRPGIPQVSSSGGQDLDGDGMEDGVIIDYSPPRFAAAVGIGTAPLRSGAPFTSLNEAGLLNETIVLAPQDRANRMIFVNAAGDKTQAQLNGDFDNDGPGDGDMDGLGDGVDWDNSDDTTGSGLSVNIDFGGPNDCQRSNPNGMLRELTGYNDWLNLSLAFGHFEDAADAPVNPVMSPEPTVEDIARIRAQRNITDLSVVKTALPDPVEVGDDLVYTLSVTNHGPNPAGKVRVMDTLPSKITYISDTGNCVEEVTDTLTCESGELSLKDVRHTAIVVGTANVCEDGIPTTLVNTASVENVNQLPAPDPSPADNSVTLSVTPVDTTPPVIETLVANPDILGPPSHKMVPVVVTASASDVCDSNPVCTIISVDSDEPSEGPGDGNTSPDWLIASDLSVDLRAERSGKGDGRVYSITVECTDASHNAITDTVTVSVPHDKRKN